MSIDTKTFLRMFENTKEVLGLMTDYGMLFFSTIEFKLIDFFPLVGCKILEETKKDKTYLIIDYPNDKTERIINFPSS